MDHDTLVEEAESNGVRLATNMLLLAAVRLGATQILIEPSTGKLTFVVPTEKSEKDAQDLAKILRGVANRLKVMTNLELQSPVTQHGDIDLNVDQTGKIFIQVDTIVSADTDVPESLRVLIAN